MDKRTLRGAVAAAAATSMTATAMLVALAASPAAAMSPTNPTALALGFNVFVEADATLTGTETDGPVALGGDLTIGGDYQIGGNDSGTFVVSDDAAPSALVIGGVIDFDDSADANVDVQNGAYLKLGDLTGADVLNTDSNNTPTVNTRVVAAGAPYESNKNVGLTVQQPFASVGPTSPIDFAAAFADFRSSSTALAGCANNLILTDAEDEPLPAVLPPGTNAFVHLVDGVTNVLNITAANLANITTLTFDGAVPTATAPLLVNVDTTAVMNTFAWDVPDLPPTSNVQAPFMLWNFPTATSLTLVTGGATLEGTLYAPNADLTDISDSNIEGQVIAASLVHGTAAANGGEMHSFPFAATLTCAGPATPTLTTEASRDTYVGKEIYDTATLAGGAAPTGTITFHLYGPDNATCSGEPIFTSTVDVTDNGEYRSESFRPTQAGTYQWVADYSGDEDNDAAQTSCGDLAEQVVVWEKKPYGGAQ